MAITTESLRRMERYKIAICDDDRRFIDYMNELLLSVSKKSAEFYPYISGEQLLDDLGRMHHLIIMDIGLGGLDGFQISQKVREVNADAVLIFCTGEFEPLPEFFEVSAYRYLKKQYGEERMKTELRAVLKKVDDCYERQFLTGKDSLVGLCKIPLEKIAYISKAKNGSTIHTVEEVFGREQTYAVKKHLMQLREELKMQGICCCADWRYWWSVWQKGICIIWFGGIFCIPGSEREIHRFSEQSISDAGTAV